jgi:hypothetical protein
MNMHVPFGGEVALQRSLPDIVAEYDTKLAAIDQALKTFNAAGDTLKMAATIAGVYGDVTIDTGHIYDSTLKTSLLKSAWKHVYQGLDIDRLASPTDKNLWKQALEKPVPFTIDNIRGTFGKYLLDPRGNILRGLAEVFCGLDDAFKSHDKMKIVVKGLPKRVILTGCGKYNTYGRDKLQSVLNALAAYQGKPLVSHRELSAAMEDENALMTDREVPPAYPGDTALKFTARGVRLRVFGNGNGHLFFEPNELKDINKALAEFYGDVLPDTPDEEPKKKPGTAVSKDLQFYPTPEKVVRDVLYHIEHRLKGAKVLEPSCGDGRFMDALRKHGADVYGIEVNAMRANVCRAKGHTVLTANFLETVPNPVYDYVIMNPPFFGFHYEKHVRHALKFLKPGGTLKAILPVTARYDHGLLDDLCIKPRYGEGSWSDLPTGSFSESGTNISTTVLTLFAPDAKTA